MCMEDVKIGRNLLSQCTTIPVTSSPTRVLSADPNRVAIIFSCDVSTPIQVAPRTANAAQGIGFCLTLQNPIFKITIEEAGNMVTEQWNAGDGAGTGTLTILTSVLQAKKSSDLG